MQTTLAFLLLLIAVVDAKKFTKCSLASELANKGIERSQIKHWVCMAQYESSFNTNVSGTNKDGSQDHGIFQINDYWNCDPKNGRRTKNGCGHPCSDYRNDDISDDVTCIKQLLREHRGSFSRVSYAYRDHCGSITDSYLIGCSF